MFKSILSNNHLSTKVEFDKYVSYIKSLVSNLLPHEYDNMIEYVNNTSAFEQYRYGNLINFNTISIDLLEVIELHIFEYRYHNGYQFLDHELAKFAYRFILDTKQSQQLIGLVHGNIYEIRGEHFEQLFGYKLSKFVDDFMNVKDKSKSLIDIINEYKTSPEFVCDVIQLNQHIIELRDSTNVHEFSRNLDYVDFINRNYCGELVDKFIEYKVHFNELFNVYHTHINSNYIYPNMILNRILLLMIKVFKIEINLTN